MKTLRKFLLRRYYKRQPIILSYEYSVNAQKQLVDILKRNVIGYTEMVAK